MQTISCLLAVFITIALLGGGCDSEDEPAGSGGQAAQGGGGTAGSTGSSDTGGLGGESSAGGSGGAPECLSCAQAMTAIESGDAQGKICEDPTSTQLFIALAQCYCAEGVCGGTAGACVTVCDPDPDPEVSQECIDCIVDSFTGACEGEAEACSTDA